MNIFITQYIFLYVLTSSLLRPDILLCGLFLPVNATDQVSHPNTPTGKILVLFVRVIPNIPIQCVSKMRRFPQSRSTPKSLFTN